MKCHFSELHLEDSEDPNVIVVGKLLFVEYTPILFSQDNTPHLKFVEQFILPKDYNYLPYIIVLIVCIIGNIMLFYIIIRKGKTDPSDYNKIDSK